MAGPGRPCERLAAHMWDLVRPHSWTTSGHPSCPRLQSRSLMSWRWFYWLKTATFCFLAIWYFWNSENIEKTFFFPLNVRHIKKLNFEVVLFHQLISMVSGLVLCFWVIHSAHPWYFATWTTNTSIVSWCFFSSTFFLPQFVCLF